MGGWISSRHGRARGHTTRTHAPPPPPQQHQCAKSINIFRHSTEQCSERLKCLSVVCISFRSAPSQASKTQSANLAPFPPPSRSSKQQRKKARGERARASSLCLLEAVGGRCCRRRRRLRICPLGYALAWLGISIDRSLGGAARTFAKKTKPNGGQWSLVTQQTFARENRAPFRFRRRDSPEQLSLIRSSEL